MGTFWCLEMLETFLFCSFDASWLVILERERIVDPSNGSINNNLSNLFIRYLHFINKNGILAKIKPNIPIKVDAQGGVIFSY